MENIRRLHAQATLPMEVFNYGRDFQQVVRESCAKHGFTAEPQHGFPPGTSEEVIREECHKTALVHEDIRRWLFGVQQRLPHYVGGNYFDVAGLACVTHELLANTEYYKQRRAALDDFYAALVIQAWTLFETLSEDLWVAALDSHPIVLSAKLADKAKLSYNDLQANAFNVQEKMGTILRSKKNDVSFRALEDIKEAYQLAFVEQGKLIFDILDDPSLRYSSAVRNLLIHKGGKVDTEFRRQVAGVSGVPVVSDNEKFPLSGKLCAELADTCRCSAVWLVMAVHGWIVGHPEKIADTGGA